MKKLAVFLMCLSVSMFALGCGGGTAPKKDGAKPPATDKDKEKKPEEKKPEDTSKPPEEKKNS